MSIVRTLRWSTFALVVLAVLIGSSLHHASTAQVRSPLSDVQWKKRPLLLFAKSRSDASLDKQVDLLRERRPDLSDRDMLVVRMAGNEEARAVIGYSSLRNGTARALHKRYEPQGRGLTVILIGKDGSEKKRWTHVVDPDEIFQIIDAMPMRQREMREADES